MNHQIAITSSCQQFALFEIFEDGKPVKGRQGRLTKTAIEKIKRSYGKDINSVEERDAAIHSMQTEIMAGLCHSLKISDKERHKYCPNSSWCKYKKIPCSDKPHQLDPVSI